MKIPLKVLEEVGFSWFRFRKGEINSCFVFVGSSSSNSSGYNNMQYSGPDLDDVKESVRQGVTKVAGRLSSMANDVMSTIQDKYGY